jgi:hypothetical protein
MRLLCNRCWPLLTPNEPMRLPSMISLYPKFVSMRPTAGLSRPPTSTTILRMTIVPFVLQQHFTSWMLRDR